ncbi:unnamed protein product [Clavelina lepadiformis]|uniref:CxC2-like cysteine cluster KDZ transposase-associated domain-containing protein n=1 Tax=Clavelina lepadiformis TaxID=159417 RepID=A0ABP0GE81_CLALP
MAGITKAKFRYWVKEPKKRKRPVYLFGKTFGPALKPNANSHIVTRSSVEGDLTATNPEIPSTSNVNSSCGELEENLNYKIRREKLSSDWRLVEEKLFKLSITLYSPERRTCCVCFEEVANIIRCGDCGRNVYYCRQCWDNCHSFVWYHLPDIWMGNMFCKMVTPVRLLKRFDGHECQSSYTRHITVVDYKVCILGFENVVSVQFCYCESEPETLLRLNLWTCSPKKPKLAVSIDLLEYFRALCLEKHLSTEGFCHALENRFLRVPGYTAGVKSLSRVLLQEVVEAYRHHVYKLQHLHGLVSSDDIDTGTLCPACEGNPEGMRTYCLDANFGLVRRILSGSKSCDPHHKQSFFLNQNEVDSFVDTYDENKYGSASKNCNDFQAGSIIRSKSKSSKLAIKGVFGVCCKHEFPTMFFDLKHGERLAYAVLAIEKLLERNENKIRVFYDIACKLKGHLQYLFFIHMAIFSLVREEVEDLTKEITSEILSGKVDQIAKLDSHLSKVEVENGILIRWDVKDDMMLKYLSSAVKKKRAEILENIYKLNIERKFLSTLIQKYPAGQTIVQRLVRSIRKVNNNIRHQITMYNKYQNVPQNEMKSITFEMVVGSGPVKNVPGFIEKKIKEQHCIRERCKEEMCHLKEDMTSVMNFYQKQINIVSNLVEGCEVVEPYVVTHQLQAEIELLSFINDIKGTVPFQANTPLLNEKLGTSDMAKLDPMEKEDDESESPINLSELQHILTEFGSESEGSDNEDEA